MRLAFAVVSLCFLAAPAFADSSAPATPDKSGAKKLGFKLILQSWTTHGTVEKSIDYAKQLGLHGIEIYPGQDLGGKTGGKWGPEMTAAQIKEMLAYAKADHVKIMDTGVIGIPNNEEQARKLFEWAKKLGITEIVSEPDPKALPMIDKLAGEYGIKVAIHDHPKGSSIYWNPDFTYSQIKNLKHIGFCRRCRPLEAQRARSRRHPRKIRQKGLFAPLQGSGEGGQRLSRRSLGHRPKPRCRNAQSTEGHGLQRPDCHRIRIHLGRADADEVRRFLLCRVRQAGQIGAKSPVSAIGCGFVCYGPSAFGRMVYGWIGTGICGRTSRALIFCSFRETWRTAWGFMI